MLISGTVSIPWDSSYILYLFSYTLVYLLLTLNHFLTFVCASATRTEFQQHTFIFHRFTTIFIFGISFVTRLFSYYGEMDMIMLVMNDILSFSTACFHNILCVRVPGCFRPVKLQTRRKQTTISRPPTAFGTWHKADHLFISSINTSCHVVFLSPWKWFTDFQTH